MSMIIHCLSVKQPWASLFFAQGNLLPKDVENRKTSLKHIGPLIIHASQALDKKADPIEMPDPEIEHTTGAILGVVFMYDCRAPGDSTSPWHVESQYGYYVSDPYQFTVAVPWKGKQGLWNLDFDELPAEAQAQVNIWGRWF